MLCSSGCQAAVFSHHLRIQTGLRQTVAVGVVVLAVDLDDDALILRKQHQEVHSPPRSSGRLGRSVCRFGWRILWILIPYAAG